MSFAPDSALIVVDMQNDFAHPDGSLYVEGADAVIAAVNAQIVRALAGGSTVVYTRDWHPETTPHFAKDGGIWPVHCVAGTWGAGLHDRLLVAGPEIRKGTNGEDGYSGFSMRDPVSGTETATGLLEALGDARSVVVTGLALDYCVKETALDGRRHDLEVVLPMSATAAVNLSEGDDEAAVQALRAAGVTIG
ncbi:MAG: isochorismatase family protein [Acidimicrobiia bacterium]|nr:isochorismatase family protein [Acidimicrobiia bacterium]